MARKKAYNPNMGELRDMVARYMGSSREIRAKHAAAAEREIDALRHEVQRKMVTDFAGSGPSEIANSTGLSRSTVVRWRDEFLEKFGGIMPTPEPQVAELTFGFQSWEGRNTAYIEGGIERLFLLTGEDFGMGDTVEEAEANKVDRPDWLTDDLMRQAVEETGVKLMLAPWKRK